MSDNNYSQLFLGSCFGFYDTSFNECKRCDLLEECKKGSSGELQKKSRRFFKKNARDINKLVRIIKEEN